MAKKHSCDVCGKIGSEDTPGGSHPVPLGWYKYTHRTTEGYNDYVIEKEICGIDCLMKAIPEISDKLKDAQKKASWL